MTIELYLIRHGIAIERSPQVEDATRSLTDVGRKKTQQIAQRLMALALQFDQLLTSPLVRAEQTAEILCQAGLSRDWETFLPLSPGGCFQDWLDWLGRWQQTQAQQRSSLKPGLETSPQRLALVGHQPDLGEWAEQLVWGTPGEKLVLKKAGIIGLLLPGTAAPVGNSTMFWLTSPRFLV